MKLLRNVTLIALTILGVSSSGFAFDHNYNSYGNLLDQYVKNGLFNYKGLKTNAQLLDSVTDQLKSLTTDEFNNFNRNQQIAFWINAYNIYTIQAIVNNYPVKKIKDIKGVWNKLKWEVAGQSLTLDNIEHDILRKKLKEPRVHMALVCASISCPQLPDFPLRSDSLETQLTFLSQQFAGDSSRNRYDEKSDKMYLSKILKWYGNDFKEKYGVKSLFEYLSEKESATVNFIYQHSSEARQRKLFKNKLSIKYLDYDWGLNEFIE